MIERQVLEQAAQKHRPIDWQEPTKEAMAAPLVYKKRNYYRDLRGQTDGTVIQRVRSCTDNAGPDMQFGLFI
jgi:hypothetical protein